MILQKLVIKHYKRFRDQTIEFPSAGIFGIVGSNGAGKSTFFETILWTLFGPADAQIAATDVTPRTLREGRARTEVSLTVETADAVYTITRKLSANGRSPEAEIYRNDEALPFVQGVREVNRYVRGTLLHMTPAAFATTFFTRQKDLSFFADLTNPARVHEMQHLLDLDALDLAQGTFRAELREAEGLLKTQRNVLAQQEGGRDYTAEIAAARAAEETSRADRNRLAAQIARIEGGQKTAGIALTQLTELHDRHTALDAERARIERDRAGAAATAAAATQQLDALDTLAERAVALAPAVARLPHAEAALQEAEAAQAHAARITAAKAEVHAAGGNVRTLSRNVDDLIGTLDALRDLVWTWDDVAAAPAGLARARALADALAPTAVMLAARVADRDILTRLQQLGSEAATAAEAVKGRVNAVAQIDARLNVVLAGGNPATSVDALTREDRQLQDALARQDTEMRAKRAEHKRYADLLRRWEGADPDEPCPTCGRPFAPDDAEIAFTSLRESIARCEREGREIAAALDATRTAGREVNRRLQADTERLTQKNSFTAQREQAVRQQADAQVHADDTARTLRDALAAADRRKLPNDDDLRDVNDELQLLQRAAFAAKQVMPLLRNLERAEARVAEQQAQLTALGPNTYDPTAHTDAQAEHTRLVALAAQLRQMRVQLDTRPQIEAQATEATRIVTACDARLMALAAEQTALGFDPDALAAAQASDLALRREMSERQGQFADARLALANAERETRELVAAAERLAALRADVASLEAEANRLALMTKGFGEFSGELSARIRPRLSDNASDLIERMTNGRYTRMEFNDTYVPLLYNDADQRFPVGKFSGGEQDVAALAARIGLAQLLAERGGYRIGFMVLDEVFGSLDSERRATVLDALAALREVVPQLFIISHVDDVRLSPVMDEVWTVAALPDGTSEVHRRDLPALLGAAA